MTVIDITFVVGAITGIVSMDIHRYFELKRVNPIVTVIVLMCLYLLIILILKGVLNG